MNRKTFTFEEFGDLYSSLIIKGMYQIGLKEYMWRYDGNDCRIPMRIIKIRNKFDRYVNTYCILDNHTVVELTEREVENLLFAYQTYHYSPTADAKQQEPWMFTDFDKQEADKLYIELSGHEPNDSYEWLEWPDGISLREPLSYPNYFFAN